VSGEHKGLERLLRLLELAGAAGRDCPRDGDRVRLLHGGREHVFAAAAVDSCVGDGLAQIRGSRLVLTHAGRSRLRRLQFPDHAFLAQHGPLEMAAPRKDCPGGPIANLGESPLARLAVPRRGQGRAWITATQLAAGEKLRADFERGGLQPRVSASWERPLSGGSRPVAAELSDFAMDARRRVERALDCLEAGLAGVALDVCCFLKGIEQVERERGWPPRSGKLMLATALSMLAGHYGIEGRAAGGRRAILQWGGEGYRPAL